MDLQSTILCVLMFVVVSVAVLLLMFNVREKSYEEAVAEQRQLTSGLLGSGQRPKPKEKKQKKSGKKVKEKPAPVENHSDTVDESESTELPESPSEGSPSKLHVEFVEPAAVLAESAHSTAGTKKRNKKDKVKPILLNKDKTQVSDVESSKILASNNFEKIHPKDEFELFNSQKEDILVKQEKHEVETKTTKAKSKQVEKDTTEQPKLKKENKDKKQSQIQQSQVNEEEQVPVLEQPVVSKPDLIVQTSVTNTNTVKEKKKKKSEFNTLQQMTANDKHDVNVSLLVPLVRKADLSRSEIQILIDLLLNKQHEAPTIIDEWSEGRTDPVQKLKRQLAEKERALTEEQEALASAQAKLREIRAELNSERSRLLQNYRNAEESLHAKHTELQAAAARVHTQNQKLQQLQAQYNEEAMTSHKLREELNAMQMQRQQLDIHLNQKQEAEASFQSQLSQIRNELQEQQSLNAQLNIELRNAREASHTEKEILHERIRQIESQAVHFKNESDQRQELARQLEESRRAYSELEHRLHLTEAELTVRFQQQLDETMRIEAGQAKAHDEVSKLQSEVGRLNILHKQQQDDHRRAVADLQTQVSSLQSEKTQLEAAQGAASDDRNKEIEILNLQNELASLRVNLQQRETQLKAEIEEVKKTARDFETELESQREKNDISLKKLKSEEEEKSRKFLQRLFPEMKLSSSDNWMSETEQAIKKYINDLQHETEENNVDSAVDIARLQSQVTHYRNIIEDTEGMLNKLQSHVEREEINWRKEIQAKEEEIEHLKEQCRIQLQTKINELEDSLHSEQQEKEKLKTECDFLKSKLDSVGPSTQVKHTQFDNGDLNGVERLVEEKNRLAEQLITEQKRCQELSEEILRLKSTEQSVPIKAVQNHTSNGTSSESAEMSSQTSVKWRC